MRLLILRRTTKIAVFPRVRPGPVGAGLSVHAPTRLCRAITPPSSNPSGNAYWAEHHTFAAPRMPTGAKLLRARHVSLSQRRRTARRPSRGLHGDRHHLPLSPDVRTQRHAPDGLGRLRSAGRTARQEDGHAAARDDREEHRHVPPPAPDARFQLRLGPRAGHDRSRLLPLDPVDLPGTVRYLVRSRPAARSPDRGTANPRRRSRRRARKRCAATRTRIAWPINPKRR